MRVRVAADLKCEVGEGPLWHVREEKLYWVDIPAGILYRYDRGTQEHEAVFEEGIIGGYTIQADGSFLLFMDQGAVRLLRDGKLSTIIEEVPRLKGSRFNDVVADPAGRVFCGTMPDEDGQAYLYRLELDGTIELVLEGIGLSNGMAFTPDRKQIYHVDSKKYLISVFDYDQTEGSLKNRRVFRQFEPSEIEPDGLTVDSEGYVWVAFWNGSCVRRFSPQGDLVQEIEVPAKKTTSMTFGGPECDELYITSAGGENRPEDGVYAGALFTVKTGVKGLPEYVSRIRL